MIKRHCVVIAVGSLLSVALAHAQSPGGYALAIGLNAVDPGHYSGWDGVLKACENDANDMRLIAVSKKLESKVLLTAKATREAVLGALAGYASDLKPGDLFVLSYSGHGGQLPDVNDDEPDGLDETWCLFNGELLDDELYAALARFSEGVRVVVYSDSCHSGTVVKYRPDDFVGADDSRMRELDKAWETYAARSRGAAMLARSIPEPVAIRTYKDNREFYDRIGRAALKENEIDLKSTVILLSGCEDDQLSYEAGANGLFTKALKDTWDDGAFTGTHQRFQVAIKAKVVQQKPQQEPSYIRIGMLNPTFEDQQSPYQIQ